MKPVRSLLYVPANEPEWVASAPSKYDADAIIYDLEDAVPPDDKDDAREVLATTLPELANEETAITVRTNAPDTSEFSTDLEAVTQEATDGIVVPKLADSEDVRRVSHILAHVETVRGLEERTELVLLPETASAFNRAEQLCTDSDRVEALIAASSPGGDIERALGFDWTRVGNERRYFISKLLMDGRAAGLEQIVAGPWLDVEDLDGLKAEVEMVRGLGYTGFQVVHPDHIAVVNNLFTPDREKAEQARELLSTFEQAEDNGVLRFDGEMIDEAHRKRAAQIVERAEAFGVL
jgi:citrate lyase subunit beta/citryl-CoA lyase